MQTLTDPRPALAAQRHEAIDYLADLHTIRRTVYALWPRDEAPGKAAEIDGLIADTQAAVVLLTDKCCERPTC